VWLTAEMSSVKQPQILSQRIENLERRLAKYDTSDVPIHKLLILKAAVELELVCGQASLVLKKDGTVRIRANEFEISALGDATINAGREFKLKGAKVSEN
jgi:type VI secretion system secreted protein VgrG